MRITQRLALVALAILMCCPASVFAQARVRVARDQVSIWGPGFTTIISVVRLGTELEVVGRQDGWYEVVVPATETSTRQTGFVAIIQVEPVSGTLPTDNGPAQGRPPGAAVRGGSLEPKQPAVRGFVQFGYQRFAAHDSCNAILGQPGGFMFGAGGDFRLPMGLFVQASAERFTQDGERAFVSDGRVFSLGIAESVTIIPIQVSAGWRFPQGRIVPYAGGGVGAYLYKEASDLALPADNVDEHFASYHVLGGVEFRGSGWLATAFEVQYTWVPDALNSEVASEFDEHDLGGIQGRVKIVIGR